MKHTEGPWSTEPFGRDTFIVKDRGNGSARHIATVRHPDDVPLIASAPELLDALEAALEWIDAVPHDVVLPTMPGFDRDWVNDVIANAKGEGK